MNSDWPVRSEGGGGQKSMGAFLATELSIYASQVLMFFFVAVLGSNFLRSEQHLLAFMNSRVNDSSIYDVVATLFAVAGVFFVIIALKRLAPNSSLTSTVIDEVLAEAPRTVYVFGSGVAGAILAAALFLKINPDASAPSPGRMAAIGCAWAFAAFLYGFALAYVFKYKANDGGEREEQERSNKSMQPTREDARG